MAYDIDTTYTNNNSSSETKDYFYYYSYSSFSSSSNSTNSLLQQHHPNNEEIILCSSSVHPHFYRCIATLKTPNHHHITCLSVHNNLLYAASGNQITTFDLITLSPTPSLFNGLDLSSGGFIKSIAFSEDHKILTAHQDGKIRAWKLRNQSNHCLITTLPTIKDRLYRLIMCRNNYVKIRRNKSTLWIEHNDAVSGLAVNNGFIYSVSWDKTLKIWRASDYKCLGSVSAHEDAVNVVTVSVNGTVFTGSADGKIKEWKWKGQGQGSDKVWEESMVGTVEKHKSTVNALALSGDGKVLLSGGCDGLIKAWEKDGENDRMVENGVVGGHDGPVLCLIRLDVDDGDYDLFVSGGADRTVRIWGRVGRECGVESRGLFCCMGVLEGHDKPVRSLAVKPSWQGGFKGVVVVFSGSLDGEIRVWEIMVSQLINKDILTK